VIQVSVTGSRCHRRHSSARADWSRQPPILG
jgi:hypothetical protein